MTFDKKTCFLPRLRASDPCFTQVEEDHNSFIFKSFLVLAKLDLKNKQINFQKSKLWFATIQSDKISC